MFLNNQNYRSIPDRFVVVVVPIDLLYLLSCLCFSCFNNLCELSNLIEEISSLSNEVRMDDFLCAWLERLLDHVLANHEETFNNLMEKTLNTMKLNSKILTFLIDSFIKRFNQETNNYLISLASIIERK